MLDISAYTLNFKLESPLSISFHTWSSRETILIFLHYMDVVGIGEAAPFKPITGDSIEEVIEELKAIRQIPFDPKKDGLEKAREFLSQENIQSPTLRAAIDFACHDLMGKIQGIPVYKFYSDRPALADNSVTVFIQDSIDRFIQETSEIYEKYPHLNILKIKLKGDGQDIERIKAIKSISDDRMKFILDANQGYDDPRWAVQELNEIGKILVNVILVEEPCPKGQLDKLKFVKDHLEGMLVFADESAATIEDVKKIISQDAVHGINIKLQKCGGILAGLEIASLCTKSDLKIMVGQMIEGPLSTSAGVHFASSTFNVLLTDLDMDLDLPIHTRGQARFEGGKRIPSEEPGFGVAFDFERIAELVKEGRAIFKRIR